MIVKVQTSLMSSDHIKHALIYNKDKSLFIELNGVDDHAQVKEISDKLCGNVKAYFEAELDEKGALKLVEEVDPQPW